MRVSTTSTFKPQLKWSWRLANSFWLGLIILLATYVIWYMSKQDMITHVSPCKYEGYRSYMVRQLEKSCATVQLCKGLYYHTIKHSIPVLHHLLAPYSTWAATNEFDPPFIVWVVQSLPCKTEAFAGMVLISVHGNCGNRLVHFAIDFVLIQVATHPTLGDSIAPLNYFPCKEHQATHSRHPCRKSSATNATKRHGSKFVHASLVQHPEQLGALMSIGSAMAWADMNSMLSISYICIYIYISLTPKRRN